MRSLTLAVALLSTCTLAPLAAAQITVGPAGGGFQFTEIQDAVDFAPPNSIILVYPANYSEPLFIDKSLTIIGDTINTWTPILVQGAGTTPTAMVEITGIDGLEEVRISGLRFDTVPQSTHALYIHDCPGRVVINDVESVDILFGFVQPMKAAVVVRDADAVVGDRWRFDSLNPIGLEELGAASVAHVVDAERCSIWLSNSLLRAPRVRPTNHSAAGAAGVFAVDSQLYFANSILRGGAGGSAPDVIGGGFFQGKSGPGLWSVNSKIRVAGGPTNGVSAGSSSNPGSQNNFAIVLENGSRLEYAADVVLENSHPSYNASKISALGGSVFTARPHRWPNIGLSAQRVSPGLEATMNSRGNPLSLHLLFYATQMQLPIDEPLLQGPIILDIGAVVQLAEFATDANGNGSFGFGIPPIPQLIGFGIHFQTLELGGAGAFISNAALLTITNVN